MKRLIDHWKRRPRTNRPLRQLRLISLFPSSRTRRTPSGILGRFAISLDGGSNDPVDRLPCRTALPSSFVWVLGHPLQKLSERIRGSTVGPLLIITQWSQGQTNASDYQRGASNYSRRAEQQSHVTSTVSRISIGVLQIVSVISGQMAFTRCSIKFEYRIVFFPQEALMRRPSSRELKPPRHLRESSIITALTCFSVASYVLRQIMPITQTLMGSDLHVSESQFGLILGAFWVGYAVFQVPAGTWADRRGTRVALAVSAIGWSVTTLLTGLIPGIVLSGPTAAFVTLLLLRFILGAVLAGTYPIATKTIHENVTLSRRDLGNSIVLCGAAVGTTITPILVVGPMTRFGWHTPFWLASLLPLPIALWWWRAQRAAARSDTTSSLHVTERMRKLVMLLKNRKLLVLSASYFLHSYVLGVFLTWLFTYLQTSRHLGEPAAARGASIGYMLGVVALPMSGWMSAGLSKRFGVLAGRRLLTTGFAILSTGSLLVGIFAADIAVAVAGFSLSIGFTFGVEAPYWATATELQKDAPAASSGLMNCIGSIAAFFASTIFLLLKNVMNWNGALMLSGVLSLAASSLWFFLEIPKSDGLTDEHQAR
jgi:MFS family permease